MTQPIEPSIRKTAFSCPHCGAHTSQTWYDIYSKEFSSDSPKPFIPTAENREHFERNRDIPESDKKIMYEWYDKLMTGLVWVESVSSSVYCGYSVSNLNLSKCYTCGKVAVWVHDRIVFPNRKFGSIPNPDLPDDIRKDFEEARDIVDASPRGAAALLRLCIQKLCKKLGQTGKDIDADIGALVKAGLNPLVQQSLDIVRVIGNEAVHPGTIDLNDNRDTALHLFDIVNEIAAQMITHPKRVTELYAKLPEAKRKAIEKRDAK
jgi:hypothetical protein